LGAMAHARRSGSRSRSRAPPSAFGTFPRCAGEGKAVASPATQGKERRWLPPRAGEAVPKGTEGGTLLARWRTREVQDQDQDQVKIKSAPIRLRHLPPLRRGRKGGCFPRARGKLSRRD